MKLRNNHNITTDSKVQRSKRMIALCSLAAYFFTLLLLFAVKDFVSAAISDDSAYEIRYEIPEELENGQKIYMLYKDGEYYKDVDINKYGLLDSEGRTHYAYCLLTEQAKELSYSVILIVMIVMVILIARDAVNGTPFTHKNAVRIRAIGILQFLLAIVPGTVGFLMTFFRFDYVSAVMTQNNVFYMLVIGFIILLVAQVFDHGVKLQEDIDSIA